MVAAAWVRLQPGLEEVVEGQGQSRYTAEDRVHRVQGAALVLQQEVRRIIIRQASKTRNGTGRCCTRRSGCM